MDDPSFHVQEKSEPGPVRFFGIRGWLLVLVFVASLPLLVLIAFNLRGQVETARAAAFDRALGRAKVLSNVIDSQVGSIDTLLMSLVHQISTDPRAIPANEALLKAVQAELPSLYFNLKAFAADGSALGASSGGRAPVDLSRRYFVEAMRGPGLAVGDPVDVDATGRWSVTLARPVLDPSGKPVALVGATISLRKLQDQLDTVALPPGSVITLLNEKGAVLARTLEPEKWVGKDLGNQPNVVKNLRRREGTDEQVSLDGSVRLGGFVTCERVPWNIYVGVPRDHAYADVRAASRNAYLLGGGSLACVVILAWLMANRITRPLLRLEEDARAFANGDLNRRAAVDTGNEVDGLARTFNVMLDSLAARNAALRLSEERYRNLIDGAPEAIVVLDAAAGKVIDHNPRAEALFRVTAAELATLSPVDLSPEVQPDGRRSSEAVREHIELVRAGGTAVFEWWHQDRAGRVFPCEVRLRRLADERRLLIRGSVTDITERKQAERELHATMVLQRAILDSASHAIISTRPDGVITLLNPAAERLLGYSAAELVGRSTPAVIHDGDEVRARAAKLDRGARELPPEGFNAVVAHAQQAPAGADEWTYVRKDGGRVPVNLVVSALRDERGGLDGFLCMATDITGRRQLERQLAHERTVMESTARGLPLAEVLTQLVLGHEKLFPGTIGSVVLLDSTGTKLRLAVAPGLPEKFCQAIEGVEIGMRSGSCGAAIFSGRTMIAEDIATDEKWADYAGFAQAHGLRACWSTPIRSAQGVVLGAFALYYREPRQPQPAELAAIDSSSQLAALVIERTQTDEARLNLERKLQETQKLESLGVLAGGIAHDFNNLLTGILGNASLASLELPEGSPIRDYLGQINEAALRAADLCKQMLAYSGRGRFVVQKVDLNRLVEETTHLLQISISKRSVLRFNLGKDLPTIEADATQIRQVVMNLVINASEAIGEKSGVISVSTGVIRIDRTYLGDTVAAADVSEGDYVSMEISDNGSGMSAETRAKIFDPFFSTKFTGRGLGLAAVLGIVRGHKGALKVYSELGRGTTFKLLFPCVAGPAEAVAVRPPARSSWRGKGLVLVADDEETIRTTAMRMLRALGFETKLVANGAEAVEAFRENPGAFALVLLDLTMPQMDGEQAFTELRRLKSDVRVVLMSGFNQQEAVARFTGKGLASFLQKPFSMEALTEVLQGVVGGEGGGR